MAEKIVMIVLGITLLIFIGRYFLLKKEIYRLSFRLEKCLDVMLSGKPVEEELQFQDSLWDKLSDKLQKLYVLWQESSKSELEEKKQLKELVSDISHQTKTPIANIKMYLELLEDECGEFQDPEKFLPKIDAQVDKLDFLIQSLVKMSRLETGILEIHKTPCALSQTLGRAVSSIVPKAENKGIELHIQCPEELVVSHDAKWTEEALFNILDNGVKYTPPGGSIYVTVAEQEMYTRIDIQDSGRGIRPDRQGEIFRRFYREPEVHEQDGIGVGLYLARKILTLQGGYIEVCSQLGEGALFRIFVPNSP